MWSLTPTYQVILHSQGSQGRLPMWGSLTCQPPRSQGEMVSKDKIDGSWGTILKDDLGSHTAIIKKSSIQMLTVDYTMSICKRAILHRKESRSCSTVMRSLISVCFSVCSKTFTGQMFKSWEVTLREVRHKVRLGSFLPFIKFKLFPWDRAPIRGKQSKKP